MMPPDSPTLTQPTFRTTISENIEDAVSGELMTRAVTLFPCGHTFNEDTIIQCLARNKLCPLDRRLIERHAPNYTVRHLAEAAESHPLEEIKHEPSQEAVGHFLRGKELAEQGEHATAIEALLQALQLTPTYEKAQAYLEFCLKRSSKASSSSQPLPLSLSEKGKEKSLSSTDSPKEGYTELLFNLLEEPSIQENSILKKILESQVEELMSQESEELNEKEKISYKWAEKLLGENEKVRQFVVEKLRQIHQESSSLAVVASQPSISFCSSSTTSSKEIQPLSPPIITTPSMTSLYNAIIQFHFPDVNGDLEQQARILDEIYKIENNLSIAEKVSYIFQELFNSAASLSPSKFKRINKKSMRITTLSNYSSHLLNFSRLLILHQLPGGKEYSSQPQIKALPLKKKDKLLTQWIEKHGRIITKLVLNGLRFTTPGLTILPSEIGQFSHIEKLCLDSNQLTTLPAAIGQLSQLKWLTVINNYLTALPTTLGQLSQLEYLYLSRNHLIALPATMGQLSQLKVLDLAMNQLTTLPATIGLLSQLTNLSLDSNQLTALPAEIVRLSKLQRLCLDISQLTALPPVIDNFLSCKGFI